MPKTLNNVDLILLEDESYQTVQTFMFLPNENIQKIPINLLNYCLDEVNEQIKQCYIEESDEEM